MASFRDNIFIIDIRSLNSSIPGVTYIQADATNLEGIADGSIESLSTLFAIEHFGLGRYGDPVDPYAWEKVICAIKRVMKDNGHVYIGVPIGYEHLEFNAHRIFYAETIVKMFEPFKLESYSCVRHDGIEASVDLHKYDEEFNYGQRIGLFHFVNSLK